MKLRFLTWVILLGIAVAGAGCKGTESAASSAPSPEASGTVDGGGGKGVLCADSRGAKTLQVLDLYESEKVRGEGLDLHVNDEAVIEQFTVFGMKMAQMLRDPAGSTSSDMRGEFASLYGEFQKQMKPARRMLPLTSDATVPVLPSNCTEVQIAIWRTNGEIDIDLDLWEMLNPRHQAALALHEYVYFYERHYGVRDSDEARWLIGRAFSNLPVEGRFPDSMFELGAEVAWCSGGGGTPPYNGPTFEIYAQDETENSVAGVAFYLHYTLWKDAYFNAFTKIRSFAPDLSLSDLVEGGKWPSELRFESSFKPGVWKFDSFETHPNGGATVTRITQPTGVASRSVIHCTIQ